MFDEFDKQFSIVTESVARRLNRRKFFDRAIKGIVATAAGLSLGNLVNIQSAFAVTCTCNYIRGSDCGAQGMGACPTSGCPSGCTVCTSTDSCGGFCNWASGLWISCGGLGQCGMGYHVCTDCKCPDCGPNESHTCTCLSGLLCGGCCSAKQVAEEAQRLHVISPYTPVESPVGQR